MEHMLQQVRMCISSVSVGVGVTSRRGLQEAAGAARAGIGVHFVSSAAVCMEAVYGSRAVWYEDGIVAHCGQVGSGDGASGKAAGASGAAADHACKARLPTLLSFPPPLALAP